MNSLKEKGEFKIEKKYLEEINKIFCAESLSEEETKQVINETYKNQGMLIDPHTAIAIGVSLNKFPAS